jgi:2-keto-4-pentenoate hydratase/2-oxohepta-3-ene-1,7-dioic acid hydratase in catechol pathway
MKKSFCRFEICADGSGAGADYGELVGDQVFAIAGDLFGDWVRTGVQYSLEEVRLQPPCKPSKILAVGLNYRSHLGGRKLPENPELFYKPPSAVVATGESIVIPRDAADVHFEGELVIVIGKRVKATSPAEAAEAIFGVTAGNDVSERGWQRGELKDLQWWRAKGCDTFAPLGPIIVTGVDYGNLMLETRVNGERAQYGSTSDLVHNCAAVVSWASQWLTLEPGDLIYTGTPGNTFALKSGDVVEVEIEEIGILRNPVS